MIEAALFPGGGVYFVGWIIGWLAIACLVGWVTSERGRGFALGFWASAIFSPLVGLLVAIAMPSRPKEVAPGSSREQETVSAHVHASAAIARRPKAVATPTTPASQAWDMVQHSVHAGDYADFLDAFRGAPEALSAARHKRQLEEWNSVNMSDQAAVERLLAERPFPALAEKLASSLIGSQLNSSQPNTERLLLEAMQRRQSVANAAAEVKELARSARERQIARQFPGAVWNDEFAGVPLSDMKTISLGQFDMGAGSREKDSNYAEKPAHRVEIIRPFALGVTPVTFSMWDAARVAGAPISTPSDEGWGRGERPVVNVSLRDVRVFIAWLNESLGYEERSAYRLPTEAEWEYACRAGTATPFHFGERALKEFAHYSSTGPLPVGKFPPNQFGLHDMSGSVMEWTADNWSEGYTEKHPRNGDAFYDGSTQYVVRGGGWSAEAFQIRSAARAHFPDDYRYRLIGFRLAKTIAAS
ncbi:MAG: formylglycine-generating enzyme family protein [Chitinophagaceae bacterium]|nr:MAG: formylglycine-generating enzyme family protein [Chitinophagaceae bacterium]